MKIRNIQLDNNIFLAPMAGYTDSSFREICKIFGAGLTFTEMISVKGLLYDSEKTLELLKRSSLEKPCAIQLFGHEPSDFVKVVQLDCIKTFDIIDINMGCPAPKIIKNNDGGAMMKNPQLAYDIVKACVDNTDKPVSVKMRLGFDENNINAIKFAKTIESAGASMITVHGRTVSQGYSGAVDYEMIRQVVEAVNIPVVANGNIVDKKSYELVKNITSAQAFMIGRGAVGNPQIFSEILNIKPKLSKLETIKKHIDLIEKVNRPNEIFEFRKHLVSYIKGINNSSELKIQAMKVSTIEELKIFVEKFLSQNLT